MGIHVISRKKLCSGHQMGKGSGTGPKSLGEGTAAKELALVHLPWSGVQKAAQDWSN